MGDITVAVQGATPSSPSTNFRRLYPKSDGWYDLDEGGVESPLGGGGGVNRSQLIHGGFFSTTGVNDPVPGLAFTPPAGTYLVRFTGWGWPQGGDDSQEMQITIDGVIDTGSVRQIARDGGGTSNVRVGFACETKVTVNGSQQIGASLSDDGGTAQIFASTFVVQETRDF